SRYPLSALPTRAAFAARWSCPLRWDRGSRSPCRAARPVTDPRPQSRDRSATSSRASRWRAPRLSREGRSMARAAAEDEVKDKGQRDENAEDDDEHLRPDGLTRRRLDVGGSARIVLVFRIAERLSHAHRPLGRFGPETDARGGVHGGRSGPRRSSGGREQWRLPLPPGGPSPPPRPAL